VSEPGPDPTVQQLREEIAAVDRAILDDVNARIELVARIRSRKSDAGLPFVDRDRERELIEALDVQNGGPLSADGLRELYTYLLDLTKREVGRDGGG
jgi:chorismate mutase